MRTPGAIRLLLFVMVCLVPAACGSSGYSTSGAAPATTTASATTASATTASATTASASTAGASQACADADALKASMAGLDQLDPAKVGKAGIQAALDKVRTNLAALKTSAKSQWSSQITELDAALQALKATITGINGDNLLPALPAIVNDLKRIDTAWTALRQQIDQDCG